MSPYRLKTGGRIDRARTLNFRFDGETLSGHPGDTLASALLANGRSLMGRSFKYHRPRGVMTANSAEPNALLTLGTGGRRTPNTRATMVDLYDGLVAESQNRWPSLRYDVGAVNGLLSRFLSAGFYYKTFMWPAPLWEKLYEPFIRRAAGLGRAGTQADPDIYEKRWLHADLLIVGAGAAGLAAALTAGRAGADVVIADEASEPGGALLFETATIGGATAAAFLAATLAELVSLPNVRILPRTTVFAWYDDNVFGALERTSDIGAAPQPGRPTERLWRLVVKQALLATGAEERPLVFPGNDRPGIVTCEAARAYASRYGVAVGAKVAVFAQSWAGARTAQALKAAGVNVTALIDSRDATAPAGLRAFAKAQVIATSTNGPALGGLTVAHDGKTERIEADALAVSGGFSPRIHLACQRGARPVWDAGLSAFLAPAGTLPAIGAAAGKQTLAAALQDGAAAAVAALESLGLNTQAPAFGVVEGDADEAPAAPLWRVKAPGKAFVDFQNDVHVADLGLAVREGYEHVELAKRYTTNGMATDQGKLSNLNAIGILAEARGLTPDQIGTTTFRPFYTPVSFGALAGPARGREFQPVRRSPLHGWAQKRGAEFVEAGLWLRASHFPAPGETHWRQTVDREAKAVRASVGLCDMSTLGKIEVFGPDAATFLDLVYATRIGALKVGSTGYGLMLREDGFVYDDGIVCRLAEDHFFLSTSTAMAGPALAHLEFAAQVLWPHLDVSLMSSTDQWAQMAVAGPRAREVLAKIIDDDLSAAAFRNRAGRAVTLNGGRIAGRLYRISFSGELAFELAVPAGYGEAVAEAIMQAGAPFGITPYGVEAMAVLRIEKGFLTHNEINGTATADDLGLSAMLPDKPDFIGKHMLSREGLTAPDRAQLVGVLPLEPSRAFKAGSHILRKAEAATLENDQGYVTSATFSPHLNSAIGLALVKAGRSRLGEEVVLWNSLDNEFTAARLVEPVFIDPTFEKLNA